MVICPAAARSTSIAAGDLPLTWLTAQPCASLLRDALYRHQECRPGGHAGNRTPDKIQRLLNQMTWDTFAVVAHRFAVVGPDQAARRRAQVAAAIDDRPGQVGGAAALHHADNVPARRRHGRTQAKNITLRVSCPPRS
jgi:hypothetical protein